MFVSFSLVIILMIYNLLLTANCNMFLFYGYSSEDCSGLQIYNGTQLLSKRYRTNNGGCYFGRDSSCSYNDPNIVTTFSEVLLIRLIIEH
jgi:hypothetical protein